ncbi:periostin-like isoform X1 [Sinocyclocheilus anshuiensis]|uniref:Periostin-like n=2 Tax=Sinocyclocheilus anshuiensis TaxID=1608454 RepID=A0A671PKF1_9TELE|nr:PREDICTED: periostin-like isoform X1 [Sinocyclocheilus anshuiensis]
MILLFTATFTILVMSSLDQVESSAYDKIVTHSRIRAKNEGPNVCALQQVMGTKKKYFSTCRNWYNKSICGKNAVVLYECCPGYMKLDGKRGCPAVAPIDTVYGTLNLVQAKITQRYSDQSKLREELDGAGSYTMFAPSDDVWEELDPASKAALVSSGNTELYNALHYHMVNKRLLTKDLKNDMTLKSMYNKQGLYINHYSNGVVTVNCARIIHANQVATNGVVHVIDRIISIISQTIKDVIETNDDLASLNTVALRSGLQGQLGEPGHYTLFAPTNEAFEKLDSDVLERLMSETTVLQALLKYHLLNSVQCSEAIMVGSVYGTLEGSNIEIGCDGESLTVNGIKMVLKKDIVTSNGVIHLINQVLMPDSAKQVMELIGKSQSIFSDMVSELGLSAAMQPETEYTILAPLNGAFFDEVMSMDQRLLKIILENHIVKLRVSLSDLYNGQLLETLGGKLLRVFIYRTAVCIENACMARGSREGSNGVLHLMRSLIQPPETTIYDLLLKDGRFKIFLSLMESAELTDLLKQEGSYTLFAPIDAAFGTLTEENIALLKSDINGLRAILLYHFSNGVFINGGLEGGVTNLLKTIQGNNLQVLSVNNSIHVNSVEVPDFDLMASNGVVHVVKTILYPQDLPVGREDILILLKRLIRYIQLKFVSGYTYHEIPLTFIKRTITTHVIEKGPEVKVVIGEPSITKVTRVIGGDLSVTKVTQVTERDPSVTKVTRVIGGDPSVTKVTQVTERDPSVTKVTRVIGGDPSVTKVTQVTERDPSVTKVTRVIGGDPSVTKVTQVTERDPSVTKVTRVIGGDPSVTKVTQVTERDPSVTKVTRVIGGDPSVTKVTQVTERDPSVTKVTRVIGGDPSVTKVTQVTERDPSVTKVTRVIGGDPSITKVTQVIGGDPGITKVVEGKPSVTKITRLTETHSASSDGEIDTEGEIKRLMGEDITKVQTFQGGDVRILQEEDMKQITDAITQGGGPGITTITKVIKPGVQVVETEPGLTTLTRVIKKDPQIIEIAPGETTITRVIQPEPQIIEGPDFSKIVSFKDSSDLLESESERITRIIKEGRSKKRAAIRQPQGSRRSVRLVRPHSRPRQ